MNNENIIFDSELKRIFLFLEKLTHIIPQIESRIGVLADGEYDDLFRECSSYLIESDSKELQISCVRVILLLKMKKIPLESVKWEKYVIDDYVTALWIFLKEWGGVLPHSIVSDTAWFESLTKKFDQILTALSLLMNMQTTHWNISRWVNSRIDYGMDYELDQVEQEGGPQAEPLNIREELERQLVVVHQEETAPDHPTFYFANVQFHTWQMSMIQDMLRSMNIIRSFLSPNISILQSPECVSFVEGIHYYIRLCLQNPNHHKECMSFLMDRWLSEMSLPGLRGTSMTTTNIINKSVWKQILPTETSILLTRIKDARLDSVWMSLRDDAPYDTCLRQAIFKQVLELTFSLYIRNRFLKVEQWMHGGIAEHQIFQHYGWWGIWEKDEQKRVYANGWNASPYVFYQWLCLQRSCIFHDAFIKMVCELRKDTLTLPPPHTEGALIVLGSNLPSYMITPQTIKKRKIIT